MVDHELLSQMQALPKIELHRHLEGSLRLQTLVAIALEHNITLPYFNVERLRPFVTVMPGEVRSADSFMQKFSTLRQFYRSPEIIKRVAYEVVADAAQDNVKYLELRFTPMALNNYMQCQYTEIVEWVCESVAAAMQKHDIQVQLLVSMNRHESVETGALAMEAALAFRDYGVAGIDLAGREDGHSAQPFLDLFKSARSAGLGVTAHAGEWAGNHSLHEAIYDLEVDRIGHGVRIVESPLLMAAIAERGTTLEVCPSSNIDSGVIPSLEEHPLPRLYQHGLRTTINTDDPLVSNITLSDELARAVEHMGLTIDDIKRLTLNAAEAAFLPDAEKAALVTRFRQMLGVV